SNVGVWKWLFMDGKPYTADASHSASWNFFFQAEDGIRDRTVTGVQTCALPIFDSGWREVADFTVGWVNAHQTPGVNNVPGARARSEERRVGKECRPRRSRYQQKKTDEARRRACNAVAGREVLRSQQLGRCHLRH